MNEILGYFTSSAEAVATLVVFAVGGAFSFVLLLISWWKRERPPKVVVQEIYNLNPFRSFASHQKFFLMYKKSADEEVKMSDFWTQKIVIYNAGTRDIGDEFNLTFFAVMPEEEEGYWDWRIEGSAIVEYVPLSNRATGTITKGLRITFPFLNSYYLHNEEHVALYVNSSSITLLSTLETSGKGWSLQHVSLLEQLDDMDSAQSYTQSPMLLLMIFTMLFGVIAISTLWIRQGWEANGFAAVLAGIAIAMLSGIVGTFSAVVMRRVPFWRRGIQPIAKFADDPKQEISWRS